MRWQLASTFALTAMSAACYESKTVDCGDGFLCPAGSDCAAPGHCGKVAQVAACIGEGIEDYNACANPADGTCRYGVCEQCSPDRAGCPTNGFVAVSKPADDDLYGVWVGRRDLAFAVGAGGATWRYDGWSWTVMTPAPVTNGNELTAVWGVDEQNLYAVGDTRLFKWNGASWGVVTDAGVELYALTGTSATDITAVGDQGTVVEHVGDSWIVSQPTAYSLYGLTTAGTTTYAVGAFGIVLKRAQSEAWSVIRAASGSSLQLNAISARSDSDLVVVGDERTVLEGASFSRVDEFDAALLPPLDFPFRGIWGDANQLFVVGDRGIILQLLAGDWALIPPETLPTADHRRAIDGADGVVFVVGDNGAIWRASL